MVMREKKTRSYSSLLAVPWDTEVEVFGKEQEHPRHFSAHLCFTHERILPGGVIQQTQPHDPVMPQELLLPLTSTSLAVQQYGCITLTVMCVQPFQKLSLKRKWRSRQQQLQKLN